MYYNEPYLWLCCLCLGALKSYLRELPEPLLTFSLYDEWTQASNVSDPDRRLQALWVACDGLPKNHKANFRYLVKFLAKLAQDSEVNKMTPSNIAIVLGPNLLWSKTEGTLAEMAAATSVHVVAIIEPIIQHADWFFPDDVDFNVSGMFVAMTPEPDPGPFERRRPGSLVDGDTPRKDSPGHDPTTTPAPLRNGGSQLTVGTPHSQAGCRGPSPHIGRRGTKKQAPAPPKQANPFVANVSTLGHSPAPNNPYPLITPRRHSGKETPIHAPSHPPPQPPQSQGESDPSPPHTPTPPSTPPHDGPTSTPFTPLSSFHSGSLPRPTRPAPKPRSRPTVPPPRQPPTNDDSNGPSGSASKVITDV
nr:rho GTPase-activating protein 17-like isoform X2 [Oncorhynchus nerka]